MAERTLIRASWVVGFDGRQHRIIRDGVVVYEGNTITHVGRRFDGQADRVINAAGKIVTPGLISTHAHLAGSPLDKSFIEDRGSPQFYMSGLYEYLPARAAAQDEEATRACVDFSLVELIRTGCTTVCELGSQTEYVAEQAERIGLRVYIGPLYRSGRWYTPDGKQVLYEWDEAGGFAGLRRALEVIDRWDGRANGRIRGLLSPAQVDTCSEGLLRETHRVATERQLPVTIHVSQSVIEFQEMLRRHGRSPIAWLRDIGFLGPDVILGHAIIIAGSSWTNYPPGDIEIMAEAGVSVAHSPWVFYRRGVALESFTRYLRAGVHIALGTATLPSRWLMRCGGPPPSASWGGAIRTRRRRPGDSTRPPSAGPGPSAGTTSAGFRRAPAPTWLSGTPARSRCRRFGTRSKTSSTAPKPMTSKRLSSTGKW